MSGDWRVRLGAAAEVPFLWEMLRAAANWDSGRPALSPAQVQEDEHLSRYLRGWGRPGDVSVVAETGTAEDAGGDDPGQGEPLRIGAAWCRLFAAAAPGYGFTDEATPELSIGVAPAFRGRGVGDALLGTLLERVAAEGVGAVSLSVEPGNRRAVRLYERYGFAVVAEGGGALTMRRHLVPAPTAWWDWAMARRRSCQRGREPGYNETFSSATGVHFQRGAGSDHGGGDIPFPPRRRRSAHR